MKASDFKYVATTPKCITAAIQQFCNQLSTDQPEFLDVQPDAFAEIGMCYRNATFLAESVGGKIVYGWLIWELTGIYLTAEHHAVIEVDGKLLDVTPQFAGERSVLFVPDRTFVFQPPRPANKYASLVKSPLIEKYVEIARRNAAIEVAGGAFGYEHSENDRQMTRILDLHVSRLRNIDERKDRRAKNKAERLRKKRAAKRYTLRNRHRLHMSLTKRDRLPHSRPID